MKKLLMFTLILTLLLASSCAPQTQAPAPEPAPAAEPEPAETPAEEEPTPVAEPVDVRVVAMKGPTGMGLVQFMEQADAGELTDNNYTFSLVPGADAITPMLAQSEVDIAAVPANLASVLYNNMEGSVQVVALNTLGVLYVLESGETIQSIEDLQGATINSGGKGTVPEMVLNYILSKNGIDPTSDVTFEWKTEQTENLTALMNEENAIAVMPQPFVTIALGRSDNIRIALDLNEEWDKIQSQEENPSSMITGVVIVRKAFAEEHPEAVSSFLDHYKASVDFVNANVSDAAQLVGQYDIVPAEVAEKAIPACNIVFIEGSEMQEKLSGYLSVLFEQNPKSIGGALPEDDFYFSR